MSRRMDDVTLAEDLRAALAELRPADGAPPALRRAVDAIPAVAHSRWDALRRVLPAAAALAVVVVAVGLVMDGRLRLGPGPVGPGADGAPDPTFDPMLEGPGIWRSVVPLLPIVFSLLAAVVGVSGVRWVLRARDLRGSMLLRSLIVAAACAAIAAPGFEPGFAQGSSYGPVLGLDVQDNAPRGADGPDAWYVTAEPGAAYAIVVSVENPGPLPIRLEGIVETETAETPMIPRWTAVWLARDQHIVPNPTDLWQRFTPTVVGPGSEIQLNLVGRSGQCAFGPGFTLGTLPGTFTTRSRTIQVVYSLFGLTQTADVEIPVQIVEPYAEHCPSS
jgi:hypothetical protein